jgi:shikimate dehydrogenase
MDQYALIGYPLGHSFSKAFFEAKFSVENIQAEYINIPCEDIIDIRQQLSAWPYLKGFNVTIPHKVSIINHLDAIDPIAQLVGAVNVVKINDGNQWHGYNTDQFGFEKILLDLCGGVIPEKALILGTGGAAAAVKFILNKHNISYFSLSRNPVGLNQISYTELSNELLKNSHLVVNTTPLGTWPEVDKCPDLAYECITSGHLCIDLVYNPPLTKFLKLCANQGAKTANGRAMLEHQALEAWRIWNPSPQEMLT